MSLTNSDASTVSNDSSKDISSGITQKVLLKVSLRWLFFNTSSWNWERMQHSAFAWSILPALKIIYPDKNDLRNALQRHMRFFNTEPTIGSPLLGSVIALEAAKADGEDIDDETYDAIKTGLMGPLAAIGDSLFGSTLNALLLSFSMGLALNGNLMGPLFFIGTLLFLNFYIVIKGVSFGYKTGMNIFDSEILSPEKLYNITKFFQILGLTVIGALSALFINLKTALSWGTPVTTLQSILDSLLPGILPLILVLSLWFLHDKKNVSALKILAVVVIIGFVGSITKII